MDRNGVRELRHRFPHSTVLLCVEVFAPNSTDDGPQLLRNTDARLTSNFHEQWRDVRTCRQITLGEDNAELFDIFVPLPGANGPARLLANLQFLSNGRHDLLDIRRPCP